MTESKYSEIMEVCCEILFVYETLSLTGVNIKNPITLHVDNVGAIFLFYNKLVSQQTKHIDFFHHFIRDYIEEVTAKNQFVRSEENLADPFIKNLSNGPFESLISRYVHPE